MRQYIVVSTHEREGRPSIITYWYGPKHGWGTTSGSSIDDSAVAKFTSRDHAERALRSVYGSLAEAKRHRYQVKSWDAALSEYRSRRSAGSS